MRTDDSRRTQEIFKGLQSDKGKPINERPCLQGYAGKKERLTAANQREPKIEEIAKEIGAERSDVVLALESISDPVSLYEPVYSDSGDTLYVLDQIGDKNDVDSWLDEISLKEAIRDLHPREKKYTVSTILSGKNTG